MGNSSQIDDIVLFFDNYGVDSQNLHTSFKLAGKDYPVVVIEDDGFLPEGVTSVYGYFLGDYPKSDKIPGKPRYFNQITVPEYWEISANNTSGKVHDLNKERARIFYSEPKHKRLVKVVDWYDDRGVVRSSDHYNRQGALYARTIFNNQGKRVNRSYFDAQGREIIVENFVTKDIILNEGKQIHMFNNKKELILYFMKKTGYEHKRLFFNTLSTSFVVSQELCQNDMGDILFWQEPARPDVPGNMKIILDGKATRTAKIMVQNKAAYDKFVELGVSTEYIHSMGYIYPFKKENAHKTEALICTNSDRIAHLQKIVEALPDMHFYITALTEMSSKLMSMDSYANVSLYPGVKMGILEELFQKCDYYFDINHEGEIVSAVQQAFLNNHMIVAFEETAHNRNYVAQKHIYKMDDVDQMIADVKQLMENEEKQADFLKEQHEWAMLESVETYKNI